MPEKKNRRHDRQTDKTNQRSVRPAHLLGLFQLDFQPLGADLETVHGLDGTLCGHCVVERDETEALAEVGDLVDEDLGADDGAEGGKHLHQVGVRHVVGEVVDEQVAAIRTCMYVHTSMGF